MQESAVMWQKSHAKLMQKFEKIQPFEPESLWDRTRRKLHSHAMVISSNAKNNKQW